MKFYETLYNVIFQAINHQSIIKQNDYIFKTEITIQISIGLYNF